MGDENSARPVIALCLPIADRQHPATVRSIAQLKIPRPFHRFDVVDKPVEIARNVLTGAVLFEVPDATHLLWIDDDMVFEPDALDRLLAHDLPIVGGLCHNPLVETEIREAETRKDILNHR